MNRAYVAGIIDGEGHIGFARTRNVIYPRVSVINTNLDLLNDLKNKYDGFIFELTARKANWKVGYQWQLGNRKCVNLLEDVYDYLRIKYNQAWLVFAWDEIRPGNNLGYWTVESEEAMNLILAQIKWLNYRGLGKDNISPIDRELGWTDVWN